MASLRERAAAMSGGRSPGRGGGRFASPARGGTGRSSLLDRSRAMSTERSRGGADRSFRSPARARTPDRRTSLASRADTMSGRPDSPARASLRRAQEMSNRRNVASRASDGLPSPPALVCVFCVCAARAHTVCVTPRWCSGDDSCPRRGPRAAAAAAADRLDSPTVVRVPSAQRAGAPSAPGETAWERPTDGAQMAAPATELWTLCAPTDEDLRSRRRGEQCRRHILTAPSRQGRQLVTRKSWLRSCEPSGKVVARR
jgi:hypothetical protein